MANPERGGALARALAVPDPYAAYGTPRREPTGDVGRGIVQQLGQGVAAGWSDELAAGAVALASQFTGAGRRQGIGNVYNETLSAERQNMAENRERLGTAGALAAQVAGGVLTGGALARALQGVFKGVSATRAALAAAGTEGAIAGAGTSEGDAWDRAKAAAIGAPVAMATHGAVNKLGRVAGARLPGDVADVPEAAGIDLGTRAQRLGMRLTGGQQTGNRSAQIAESAGRRSAMTANVYDAATKHNRVSANRAVLSRFGRSGDRVDGDVIDSIRKEIGDEFDDIGRQMAPSVQPTQSANDSLQRAADYLGDVEKPARLSKHIADVEEILTNPAGASPQTVMIRLSKVRQSTARAARAGEINDAEALGELEDALVDAAIQNNPQLADRLMAARRAWRDLKIIDAPGVADLATGQVNPVNLAGRLARDKYTRRVFGQTAETDNPIMELGRMVRQLNDAIGDPGQAWGFNRGSFTPEGLSLSSVGSALMTPAKMAIAYGQTRGSAATTAATQGANRIAPRIAALNLTPREPGGGRNNRNK